MSQQTARASARCEGCGKVYRVPNPGRTYSCKACGGTVRATSEPDEPEHPVLAGTVTCTECQAINPGGTHFCAECGASVEYTAPAEGSAAAARLRQEASDALKRACRWIDGVAVTYRFGAAAYVVATMFAVVALARTDVPREMGVLVVALTTLLSVLFLMGALHILFRPVLWTVVIAALASAVSVVHFIGPDPFGLASIASAAWAVLAWAALLPTMRFQRLIAQHRDLYILHHASTQTRRALRGHNAHERHERLLGAMARAGRRAWKLSAAIAGVICLASALGTFVVLSSLRPQAFESTRAAFEAAWNEADLAAIDAWFDPSVRAAQSAQLAGRLTGHGWLPVPPPLTGGEVQRKDESVVVDYDLAGVDVSTTWNRFDRRWTLVALDVPLPPLEPTLESFVAAWRSSDPDAIAEFYAPENRAKMRASIRDAVSGRDWISFPSIIDTQTEDVGQGGATATFILSKGELTTQWHFRSEGVWRLHGLKFPKR